MLFHIAFSQSAHDVLGQVQRLQSDGEGFYAAGLFPVERTWNNGKDPVEDNTIFFTASAAHTLRELYPRMDAGMKAIALNLLDKAGGNFQSYRSRNGEPTYNFWPTIAPDLPFPNGNKWISNPKMRLPDDLDTSILVALASGDDSIKLNLRRKMVAYAGRANRDESKLNTLKKYEASQAYEAWFAKDMPQTFDICVLSNAMLFVLGEKYPLNRYDSATILLLKRMIMEEDLYEHLDEISHHTTSKALILYHVARMVHADHQGVFDEVRPLVIDQLFQELNQAATEFEKMLAAASLMRLNQYSLNGINHQRLQSELDEFTFFFSQTFSRKSAALFSKWPGTKHQLDLRILQLDALPGIFTAK